MTEQDKLEERKKVFSLDVHFENRLQERLFGLVKKGLERTLSLSTLNRWYLSAADDEKNELAFIKRLLDVINLKIVMSDSDFERIPKTGKVVVVANHPYGGIEGVILGSILRSVREDSKIMANYILKRIPDLRDLFIFVDPFDSESSKQANLAALRDTISWINQDNMMGIFPAGEVSHYDLKKGRVTDPPWHESIAKIVRITKSPVVPIYFDGFNGPLFQLAGMIHPRLRTALLPHELANKKDKTIEIRVGNLIPHKKLAAFKTNDELIGYLRDRTYLLENRETKKKVARNAMSFFMQLKKEEMQDIEPAVPADILKNEIDNLPEDNRLFDADEHSVFAAEAKDIPNILKEIGRLREVTFRETGEGTGKSTDIDIFDEYYIHLFVWNNDKSEVVGAYRLGRADEIIREKGVAGLYTSTLFDYTEELLVKLGPCLEMGRSFVRKEYQRSFSPLLLLWRGIGAYVVKNPDHHILFGPVSINNEYQSISRQLMVTFLKVNNYDHDLAQLVRAKRPFRARQKLKGVEHGRPDRIVQSLEEVSAIISDIETAQKGVPILLKQYLKLGGKLIGFNVDPDFSDVLDGLILVDLAKTDKKLLSRYMGKQGAEQFLDYHRTR